MHSRLTFGSLSLGLLALLCAPAVSQSLAAQNPDPAKELADLQKEKERLQQEISYAKERVAHSKDLLRGLGKNKISWRAIDAGKTMATSSPTAPPMARRPARLMADDEKASAARDTMLMVNGNAISQPAYDELMAYLGATPGDAQVQSMRSMMCLADLIRIEVMTNEFRENGSETRLAEALAEMEGGKGIGDVIKKYGTLRDVPADGKIEVTRNSVHGPRFEFVAFSTPAGARSRPFRHHTGFVVIQVDSVAKGATPELDKISAQVLCVPYAEAEAVLKTESQLANGQVDIVVRDKDVMRMLPPGFQDPDDLRATAAATGVQTMEKALAEIEDEIAKLSQSPDESARARAKDLTRRRDAMKSRLEGIKKMPEASGEPKK